MGNLKHVTGDLIRLAKAGEFDIIVHGANCFCTMGSGIARQIREQYPQAYAADCETKPGDKSKLGSFTMASADEKFIIINAYTQYDFNKPGENEDKFDYEGFELILANLLHEAGDLRFGFPYIGMGLAGGDKTKIINMLETFATNVAKRNGSVTLVAFEQ